MCDGVTTTTFTMAPLRPATAVTAKNAMRVRVSLLTDEDIRRNCECIFDARGVSSGSKSHHHHHHHYNHHCANRAKIFAKLYDNKVFGANPYDISSPCETCKQPILQCPNRPAYIELGFDYVVPLFVDKFYSLVTRALPPGVPRSRIVTYRKSLHNSDMYASIMQSVKSRFPIEYARYTSSCLLVRPPCTRPEYMRERNMQQLSMGAIGGGLKRRTVYRLCDYYPIINKLMAYCANPTVAGKRRIISMIYAMTVRTANNNANNGITPHISSASLPPIAAAAAAAAPMLETNMQQQPQQRQEQDEEEEQQQRGENQEEKEYGGRRKASAVVNTTAAITSSATTSPSGVTLMTRGAKQSLLDTLSHKKGVLRQQCSGVRPTFTVRGVIVCRADLCAWNVAVPKDAFAYLRGKTVFLCRQPTLYSAGMQLVVPVPHNAETVLGVTHELSGSFNQDYDGDEMTLYAFQGESADSVLNSLPILLYTELNGIELLRCSYNMVLAVYMLTRWPHARLPSGETYASFFDNSLLVPWMLDEDRITPEMASVLIESYKKARRNGDRPWVKRDVLEWDAFVLRMLKGHEESYVQNRRRVSMACDAFMTWATPPVTSADFDAASKKFVEEYGVVPTNFDSAQEMASYWERITSTVVDMILSEHSALAIMINSNAKGSAMHAVQAIGCIGPVIVNYYATDFADLCGRFGMTVFSNELSAFAWVPQNLWTGLNPRQHFVVACNTIENMVRSIVNTSEGGYWRRSMQFTLDALSIDETYCVNDMDGRVTKFMPPVFNVQAMVKYMCAQMFALYGDSTFATEETFQRACQIANAGSSDVLLISPEDCFFTNDDGLLVRLIHFEECETM